MRPRRLLAHLRDERGASMAVAAVMLVGVLSVLALAIDLGMLFTARGEAQRTADAAALAGASAFLDYLQNEAEPHAQDRAMEFATQNFVRNVPVADDEVTVQVIPDEYKVQVWIRRQGVPLWFARLLGNPLGNVTGYAAAAAVQAGAATCLAPVALPDMWLDPAGDENENRHWDPGEEWTVDPNVIEYGRYEPGAAAGAATATGYGSTFRDGFYDSDGGTYLRDLGRQIIIKPQSPQEDGTPNGPGFFYPWKVSDEPGAAAYRRHWNECTEREIVLGAEYDVEPGNMVGPTRQAVEELISRDPDAYWQPNADGTGGKVVDSKYGEAWINSPRVVKIAMFDPRLILDIRGRSKIVFNNFAYMFVEGIGAPEPGGGGPPQRPVIARFLWHTSGTGGGGPHQGSLVRTLRLVE